MKKYTKFILLGIIITFSLIGINAWIINKPAEEDQTQEPANLDEYANYRDEMAKNTKETEKNLEDMTLEELVEVKVEESRRGERTGLQLPAHIPLDEFMKKLEERLAEEGLGKIVPDPNIGKTSIVGTELEKYLVREEDLLEGYSFDNKSNPMISYSIDKGTYIQEGNYFRVNFDQLCKDNHSNECNNLSNLYQNFLKNQNGEFLRIITYYPNSKSAGIDMLESLKSSIEYRQIYNTKPCNVHGILANEDRSVLITAGVDEESALAKMHGIEDQVADPEDIKAILHKTADRLNMEYIPGCYD